MVAALERAVAAGKLRHYGLCNFGTDDMAVPQRSSGPRPPSCCTARPPPNPGAAQVFLAAGGKPVTNQLPYNLLWRAIESGVLPDCIDRDIGAAATRWSCCGSSPQRTAASSSRVWRRR
eukprot:SAG11_NODE_5812_length_1458_cov_3.442973_2_plen_119_part_00